MSFNFTASTKNHFPFSYVQFAHGKEELRPVARHPKYKTEVCNTLVDSYFANLLSYLSLTFNCLQICRTFSTNGTCPYGKRCRFIHKTSLSECPDSVKKTLSEDISMLIKSEKKLGAVEPVHTGTNNDKGSNAPNSTPTTPRRRLKIFAESNLHVSDKDSSSASSKEDSKEECKH